MAKEVFSKADLIGVSLYVGRRGVDMRVLFPPEEEGGEFELFFVIGFTAGDHMIKRFVNQMPDGAVAEFVGDCSVMNQKHRVRSNTAGALARESGANQDWRRPQRSESEVRAEAIFRRIQEERKAFQDDLLKQQRAIARAERREVIDDEEVQQEEPQGSQEVQLSPEGEEPQGDAPQA